jgi:hypothetical protein
MSAPSPDPPPYLTAVLSLSPGLKPGEYQTAWVLHDDGCPLLAGTGGCACNPVVTRGFTLWHRTGRLAMWVRVETVPHRRQCLELIAESGKKGGDWLILPAEQSP